MSKVHFIERITNIKMLSKEDNLWESHAWALSKDTADKLIGAEVYFHKGQDKPSHFGGIVLNYRFIESGENEGRVAITFKAESRFKDVKTDKKGWSMEKKFEWD
jgi:hypothetical protein